MEQHLEIGVGSSYGHGWRQLREHFLVVLGATIVVLIAGSFTGGTHEADGSGFSFLGLAFQVLVYGPVSYGASWLFLKAARDEGPRFGDLFEGFRDYGNVVLVNVLVGLILGVGFLLLIIPGIYFACKLVLTPFLVMDRKMRALDAIKESWRLTEGHAWTVFLMGLLALPIIIAGLLCLGVGVIVSVMWIGLAFAALYIAITGSKPSEGSADLFSQL